MAGSISWEEEAYAFAVGPLSEAGNKKRRSSGELGAIENVDGIAELVALVNADLSSSDEFL